MTKKIQSALISVYYKDNLAPIVKLLNQNGVKIYSTGGTQTFIEELGIKVIPVEEITSYPSILGGRVKTLHPKIFGGILYRREESSDVEAVTKYEIPPLDLVIVDLYPFEETVAKKATHEDTIEKIDIGGISLIRAAAKNYNDVLIVSSREQYGEVEKLLTEKNCATDLADRQYFAAASFDITSHYDTAIFNWFNGTLPAEKQFTRYKESIRQADVLRYGENPHQKGIFFGDLSSLFDKLNGKEISYNNLVDIDAAVALIDEFPTTEGTAFAILKHNNACGCAVGNSSKEAYLKALQADPISAFGGVLVTNNTVDKDAATEIDKLFIEVLIAPDFTEEALTVLKSKKNRILLKRKNTALPTMLYKTLLNGVIAMDKDLKTETAADLKVVTTATPTENQIKALLFANKLVKHTKSNTIVFAVEGQLFASGVGQTSRIDALHQAIHKAQSFGFDLSKAVMASDAFFPFPDCIEAAASVGVKAVIQPGGSIKDQDSIDACNKAGIAMVLTGTRHFKH
jgi:phosphoribosylaminoimidazolecarboxamide formyltransferase/IMP cyclohydrolase